MRALISADFTIDPNSEQRRVTGYPRRRRQHSRKRLRRSLLRIDRREYHIIRLLQLPRISAFSPRHSRLPGKSMRAQEKHLLIRASSLPVLVRTRTFLVSRAREYRHYNCRRCDVYVRSMTPGRPFAYTCAPRTCRCVSARLCVFGARVEKSPVNGAVTLMQYRRIRAG